MEARHRRALCRLHGRHRSRERRRWRWRELPIFAHAGDSMSASRPKSNLRNLLDLTPAAAHQQLAQFFERSGEPAYRANQVLRRLWQTPVPTFDAISEMPKRLRDLLAEEF